MTVFHQKGGVSLVLLVMREVEGDEDIAAVCCWTLASTCTRGECWGVCLSQYITRVLQVIGHKMSDSQEKREF